MMNKHYKDNEIEILDTDDNSTVLKNEKLEDSDRYCDSLLIKNKEFGLVHKNEDEKMDIETIRKIYGEPVNKNPLLEIPAPDMRLYFVNEFFFETLDDY